VKSLYEILPKGKEGGAEFARVVDLLLFHQARRAGRNITLFNDAAGDYAGLDSFEHAISRRDGETGYQYKFYPSPLSAEHRKDIEASLAVALKNRKKLKLKRWVLVTPQDFVESSARVDGGDVTWFEKLHYKARTGLDLEHFGHKKLLTLFLETRALCLFYYPELVADGTDRKHSIQDTQKRYEDNLTTLHREITFVGMSVYKPEATRGVPMEHIYIPLAVVPDGASTVGSSIPRVNPLSLLSTHDHHVVLGDPGSGKSTLLRFLSLVGKSKPLQDRCSASPDTRLPIVVTLRRYADELKQRRNLSLIDYIRETIRADFNLLSADEEFFDYFLETGQAIMLFDGLDELPTPEFKVVVRDRIRSLATTFPGNMMIVTSRIVGYENPFRFDERTFAHYRLTKLLLPEMEQFVRDWYTVRIENEKDREASVKDLVRILRDEDHVAIRELAENPLLLTIVALVHRIDAVLPDERVVLYQKCTETLLNTWHAWKFKNVEVKSKGKVERRNRRRMEAIAFWMHCRGGQTQFGQRAIVPYEELRDFLANHVSTVEGAYDPENDPEDLANEFLDFVKKRAGLLIEVGEDKYSFVHLTFQEYLASSNIITTNETAGIKGIWGDIEEHCTDPRWHEVIRLLVAGLKSEESKKVIVDQVLNVESTDPFGAHARLLGGLLIDGIDQAELRRDEILRRVLCCAASLKDTNNLRSTLSNVSAWMSKEERHIDFTKKALGAACGDCMRPAHRAGLSLAELILRAPSSLLRPDGWQVPAPSETFKSLARLLLGVEGYQVHEGTLNDRLRLYWVLQCACALTSSDLNFLAAATQAIASVLDGGLAMRRIFEHQLVLLSEGAYSGPFTDFTFNALVIKDYLHGPFRDFHKGGRLEPENRSAINNLHRALDIRVSRKKRAEPMNRSWWRTAKTLGWKEGARRISETGSPFYGTALWRDVVGSSRYYAPILDYLCDAFALRPRAQWWEALRVNFLPAVPERLIGYDQKVWQKVKSNLSSGSFGEFELYNAATQLLVDAWLSIFMTDSARRDLRFEEVAEISRPINHPALTLAHAIRDAAAGDDSHRRELAERFREELEQINHRWRGPGQRAFAQ
jgi:energy-coupling factor transporter ATP-binding protein EcfA2